MEPRGASNTGAARCPVKARSPGLPGLDWAGSGRRSTCSWMIEDVVPLPPEQCHPAWQCSHRGRRRTLATERLRAPPPMNGLLLPPPLPPTCRPPAAKSSTHTAVGAAAGAGGGPRSARAGAAAVQKRHAQLRHFFCGASPAPPGRCVPHLANIDTLQGPPPRRSRCLERLVRRRRPAGGRVVRPGPRGRQRHRSKPRRPRLIRLPPVWAAAPRRERGQRDAAAADTALWPGHLHVHPPHPGGWARGLGPAAARCGASGRQLAPPAGPARAPAFQSRSAWRGARPRQTCSLQPPAARGDGSPSAHPPHTPPPAPPRPSAADAEQRGGPRGHHRRPPARRRLGQRQHRAQRAADNPNDGAAHGGVHRRPQGAGAGGGAWGPLGPRP